jgi:hypothetical protein
MRLAVEHVRRMRGGAQSHLMRCDDGGYYIVKFQNNPQHLRILANEMLATRMAARMGLCVPQIEVVEVRPELISYSSDLVIQLGLGRKPCAAGKQFGSQFPGHPARMAVHDFFCPTKSWPRSGISPTFSAYLCLINGRATQISKCYVVGVSSLFLCLSSRYSTVFGIKCSQVVPNNMEPCS